MCVRTLLVVGLVVCGAVAAGAQEVDVDQFFPGVARIAGEPPSQWVSDVTVANLMDIPIEIGFLFFRENTAHDASVFSIPEEHRFHLAERETRVFEDVLATVFGITQNTKGALLVTSNPFMLGGDPEDEDELYFLATMRTYDVSSPVGTYGQSIPANSIVDNSSAEPSFITGVRNDSRFRSNLGMINGSLQEITVNYIIRGANGGVLAEGSKVLPPIYIRQWRLGDLGVGSTQGPLTIDLWMDPDDVVDPCEGTLEGGTSFSAYVSKVDSDTQDAEFLYAAPAWVASFECF